MPTDIESGYGKGFWDVRESYRSEALARGVSPSEAGSQGLQAAQDALRPYYCTMHYTYAGRSYTHWEVGEVDGNRRVALFILGGDTRTDEALEIAFQLKRARDAGVEDARRALRDALNLD